MLIGKPMDLVTNWGSRWSALSHRNSPLLYSAHASGNAISPQRTQDGFTLVELAIVLLIVSLMLGGLMISLSQTRESANSADAKAQLAEVEEALLGFAQASGRLPCPATPTSSGTEAPAGGGTCTLQHGFVPSATLGLRGAVNADGLLLDPWGNPLRYSVTNAGTWDFTFPGRMQSVTIGLLAPNLRVCSVATCTPGSTVIVSTIPAVVLSMGKNWDTFTSADEVANAGENTVTGGPSGTTYRIASNNDFVSRDHNDTNFDDLITWLSPNILYTRMIAAGKLP